MHVSLVKLKNFNKTNKKIGKKFQFSTVECIERIKNCILLYENEFVNFFSSIFSNKMINSWNHLLYLFCFFFLSQNTHTHTKTNSGYSTRKNTHSRAPFSGRVCQINEKNILTTIILLLYQIKCYNIFKVYHLYHWSIDKYENDEEFVMFDVSTIHNEMSHEPFERCIFHAMV